MESQKVDMFLMTNAKYFETTHLGTIREKLLQTDDNKAFAIQTQQYLDPTIMLVVSIVAGHLGVDRFIIGDVGMGVGKLLTCGGLGIWTIIDWFMIMGDTRVKNLQKLQMATMY